MVEQNPTISFIIPTLQEESVLEKLLNNLKQITELSYEIIVSDGGSKDKTQEIANRLANKLVVYKDTKRQTIAQARNMGAREATGEFLIFLDADVYITNPNVFFKRAVESFRRDAKLVGLSGWVRVFPEMETFGDLIGYVIICDCLFYIQNNILGTGATCGEFQMVKRDVFKRMGGYREHLAVGEDMDLFYKLAKIGKTKTDPKLLVYHTGRRPHKIGWLRLYWEWMKNVIHLNLFDKSHNDEWEVIR